MMTLLDKLLEGRDERERLILLGGIALAIPLCIWLLIWQPLLKSSAASEEKLAQKHDAYLWMQQASAQIRAAAPAGKRAVAAGSPQELITRAGREHRLNISRIEPQSGGRYSLWLASADYNDAVRFIDTLLQSGLTIDSVTMAQLGVPGTVSLRLNLGSAG